MIKINNNSIIYVLCPAYLKTGGPELLHQLVYNLNECGIKSYITYYAYKNDNKEYTNNDFKKYVKTYKVIDDIVDDFNNIIVIPEVSVNVINKYKKIKKIIWWLSVDNFEYRYNYRMAKDMFNRKIALKCEIKKILHNSKKDIYKADYHLCQSYYAVDYLKKMGINECIYLSDYINDSFLYTNINLGYKENIVLYNPKKGYKFTKKIIDKSPNIKWIPIQNMTTNQVRDTLLKAKVYIDFGNHPGKDRFPREAAMCGCCVITGKRGSAAFYQDVSIDDEFKFEDKDENIIYIIEKIKECLEKYECEINKFENYKKIIRNEKIKFVEDIKNIFVVK